jgi:predicted lysophospholipase L1 biosynthesis ABC-type transport system permease subunit
MPENEKDLIPAPPAPLTRADRFLDLIALLSVLAVVTGVFMAAGPEVFAAVTGVSGGLFAAWRGRRDVE